ncbi:MAG: LysR family transcriptional regulator [Rhizobiaceae bacterium]|nr:LysR family transcriptional regulator [Rhizobiaceae bacterium]
MNVFQRPPEQQLMRALTRINFKHLRLLVLISATSNLHRAGEAMNVTQSAATKMLQNIETALDVRIFERTSRALVPTDIGKFIIDFASTTLADSGRFFASLQNLKDGGYGELAVGAIMSTVTKLLPVAIAELKALRPLVKIRIVSDTSDRLLEELEHGDLDLVIARYSNTKQPVLFSREAIGIDPIGIFASADHPLAGRKAIKAAELLNYPWVLQSRDSPQREILDEYFSQSGLDTPRNLVETGSVFATLQLVSQAKMLSAMHDDIVATASGNFVRLPITLADPREPFGIIKRRGIEWSPIAAEFADILRTVARKQGYSLHDRSSQREPRSTIDGVCEGSPV